MDGILFIDKPKGWTSFDVVAKVRGVLRSMQKEGKISTEQRVRVGHSGTLDPLATGLLVLLLGSYTKKATQLTKLDKTYEVIMKLGETSTTGDAEGTITTFNPQKIAHNTQLVKIGNKLPAVMDDFVGEIIQTPPAFSALKVNGKRAYKMAREGKEVKLEPRKVQIYRIELDKYEYPFIRFTTEVSSGTYIRSLVEDMGKHLGTGAYLSDLRRTKVGNFEISKAISMAKLSPKLIEKNLETIE